MRRRRRCAAQLERPLRGQRERGVTFGNIDACAQQPTLRSPSDTNLSAPLNDFCGSILGQTTGSATRLVAPVRASVVVAFLQHLAMVDPWLSQVVLWRGI